MDVRSNITQATRAHFSIQAPWAGSARPPTAVFVAGWAISDPHRAAYKTSMDQSMTTDQVQARAEVIRTTFNAAAVHFDEPPLFFWDHCGRRTVELAGVASGHVVLDVCCGTGAASLVAAQRVGPAGRIRGIDIADRPLEKARAKAADRGLTNVEFSCGDMASLSECDGSFDEVMCIFALYYALNMSAVLAELWRVVRPGGTLAVTTWGRRILEPANTIYLDAVFAQRPDFRPPVMAWERINTPHLLEQLFASAGVTGPVVSPEVITRPMCAEGFWTVVKGSGHRVLVDAMTPEDARQVQATLFNNMTKDAVGEVTSDILYACARKP
jgi:ubiquinone/menaquinone biosynthesis C-methylase UbiE